jgi:hypothetical protein
MSSVLLLLLLLLLLSLRLSPIHENTWLATPVSLPP